MKQLIIEKKDISPSESNMSVLGVFNPAVTRYQDEIILLARVSETIIQTDHENFLVPIVDGNNKIEVVRLPKNSPHYDYSDMRVIKNHQKNYLTSMSHFRVGRSKDGIHFDFADNDIIFPTGMYEEYGIEDPRITKIEDTYYITYTGVSSYGINVRLMTTKDFVTYERHGNIFHPDNKDCVIFPEKVDGKYYCMHRPSFSQFAKLDIWLAESDDCIKWGNHKVILDANVDFFDSARIGAGSVPILTDKGWLTIYHSADQHSNYILVAMLLDKNQPDKVLMRSKEPLLKPTEPYELDGFMEGVVFTCGHLLDGEDVLLYYGVCDESIAVSRISMKDIWNNLKEVTS